MTWNPDDWLNIPKELRDRPQWMVCRRDKVPLTLSGYKGDPTDERNWSSFAAACAVAEANGLCVGYCISDKDDVTVLDMDNKQLIPEYTELINQAIDHFDTYIDRSLSGLGYHAWLYGNVGKGCNFPSSPFELYSNKRFIIMTGDVLPDKQRPISGAYRQELQQWAAQSGPASGYEPGAIDWNAPATPEELELDNRCLQWFSTFPNVARIEYAFEGRDFDDPNADNSKYDAYLMQLYYKFNDWRPEQRDLATVRMFMRSARARYLRRKTDWRQYVARTLSFVKGRVAMEESPIGGLQDAVDRMRMNGQAGHIHMNGTPNVLPFPARMPGLGVPDRSQNPFRFLSTDELLSLPSVKWVIRDLFEQQSVGIIYGWSGISKTLLIIDMMEAIATGRVWMGMPVARMPVAYIGLEGMRGGFQQRMLAWEKHNGRPYPRDRMGYSTENFNLRRDKVQMALALGQLNGFIVIDTLAQSIAGTDENSFKEMSEVYDAISYIRDNTLSTVVVVHHSTKPDADGKHGHLPRGHGSLYANFSGAMEIVGDEASEYRTWIAKRVKEGKSGTERNYRLIEVNTGLIDEFGMPITSQVVEHCGAWENGGEGDVATQGRKQGWVSGRQADDAIRRQADRNCRMTPQQAIKQAIAELGGEARCYGKYGSGENNPCAIERDVIERAIILRQHGVAHQGRKDIKREVDNMKNNKKLGFCIEKSNIIWLWVK